MPSKAFLPFLAFTLIISSAVTALAEMESNGYRIATSIISSGGMTVNSANYQMTTTVGQSSCIGQSLSGSYIIYAGFWQPETQPQEGMFYIIPNKKGGAAVIYLE